MKASGSPARSSENTSARTSTLRDSAAPATPPKNDTMPADSASAGSIAGPPRSSSAMRSARRCTRCAPAGAAIAIQARKRGTSRCFTWLSSWATTELTSAGGKSRSSVSKSTTRLVRPSPFTYAFAAVVRLLASTR